MLKRLLATAGVLVSMPAAAYTYQDEKIVFELPGQWHLESEPAAWISLRSEKNNAQFIVGLVRVKEPMPTYEARLKNIETLASVRREQMAKQSSGDVQIGEPTVAQVGDQLVYDFMAKSFSPALRMYIRLIQRNDTIATFSLYDFGDGSDDQFLQLARSAFSSTKVK